MKPVRSPFVVALAVLCSSVFLCYSQPVANQAVSVTELKSVPDGNYLVTLELEGKVQRLNFLMQNNQAKCVNSSDPKLKGIQGRFEAKSNGVFIAFLQGGAFRSSQIWIFRADGAASIREVPDRGEQQTAVPIKGNSIESPTRK